MTRARRCVRSGVMANMVITHLHVHLLLILPQLEGRNVGDGDPLATLEGPPCKSSGVTKSSGKNKTAKKKRENNCYSYMGL